jgi:hypothetical protein
MLLVRVFLKMSSITGNWTVDAWRVHSIISPILAAMLDSMCSKNLYGGHRDIFRHSESRPLKSCTFEQRLAARPMSSHGALYVFKLDKYKMQANRRITHSTCNRSRDVTICTDIGVHYRGSICRAIDLSLAVCHTHV